MYKITNDITHIEKSKYSTPATEMETRGSYDFKYYVEYTMMHLSILNFLELLENGKINHQNLYNFSNYMQV